MHEFAITQGIVSAAREALERLPPPLPRVSRVSVRIGRLTGLSPESLRHYFGMLVAGTPLEGSRLAIEEVPIHVRCAECGARTDVESLRFTCSACASGLVEIVSGRELEVTSLDTLDDLEGASNGN